MSDGFVADSAWHEGQLKFMRLNILQSQYNMYFAEGDFTRAFNACDLIEQEIWGHCTETERKQLEAMRQKISVVLSCRNMTLLKNRIREYSKRLFEIKAARKMDMPVQADVRRSLLNRS